MADDVTNPPLAVHMPADDKERFRRRCDRLERSMAAHVRWLIREDLRLNPAPGDREPAA